jgi:hypothetical protein
MYLWAEDYDNCIKYADIVIASKKQYAEDYYKEYYRNFSQQVQVDKRLNGFPLIYHLISGTVYGDAYETIFTSETRREAAKEVIFELNYDRDPASTGGTANSAISSFYGNSQSEVGLVTGSSYIDGEMKESTAKELFEKDKELKDARMYMNYSTNLKSIVKMACRSINVTSAATSDAAPTSISFSLFPQNSNGSHWVIYRLSDIMLLKAEALCQKMVDGTDPEDMAINTPLLNEAFYLVNAVNKRSICKKELAANDTLQLNTGATKAQMSELVKRERQRELMYEGKRWYDLVRYAMRAGNTNEIISATSKRDDVNAGFVANFFKKMDAIFWPYNLEELKVNRNLVPNPAFSSGENESMDKS